MLRSFWFTFSDDLNDGRGGECVTNRRVHARFAYRFSAVLFERRRVASGGVQRVLRHFAPTFRSINHLRRPMCQDGSTTRGLARLLVVFSWRRWLFEDVFHWQFFLQEQFLGLQADYHCGDFELGQYVNGIRRLPRSCQDFHVIGSGFSFFIVVFFPFRRLGLRAAPFSRATIGKGYDLVRLRGFLCRQGPSTHADLVRGVLVRRVLRTSGRQLLLIFHGASSLILCASQGNVLVFAGGGHGRLTIQHVFRDVKGRIGRGLFRLVRVRPGGRVLFLHLGRRVGPVFLNCNFRVVRSLASGKRSVRALRLRLRLLILGLTRIRGLVSGAGRAIDVPLCRRRLFASILQWLVVLRSLFGKAHGRHRQHAGFVKGVDGRARLCVQGLLFCKCLVLRPVGDGRSVGYRGGSG